MRQHFATFIEYQYISVHTDLHHFVGLASALAIADSTDASTLAQSALSSSSADKKY
jgi:hypothetical protein